MKTTTRFPTALAPPALSEVEREANLAAGWLPTTTGSYDYISSPAWQAALWRRQTMRVIDEATSPTTPPPTQSTYDQDDTTTQAD